MDKESFNWKVAGFAGEGIVTTGLLFSKTCARHGWYIFDYPEYPSLIRGGHNTYQVHAGKNPVYCQKITLDVLIALNKESLVVHQDELDENSVVIYDQEDDDIDINRYHLAAKSINLPMTRLASEAGGEKVMGNNVALGASIYLLGLDLEVLNQLIADVFADKGEKVIGLNQRAAAAGFNFLKKETQPFMTIAKQEQKNLVTMTGNEAIALGALAGGLQFFVAYPMTPSSSILHFLAEKAPQTKIVVKHAEDEISAANMALGASFAGARSMVATSGGGFCYMIEALGAAGITELPLVVVEAMRPGPALGLPTWTAQGDLKFLVHASHDEFPRFVFAPSDAGEAFELSRKALELSEKYQVPAILISDKYLSESRYSFQLESSFFKNTRFGFEVSSKADTCGFYPRYRLTESGVSNRPIPGQPGGIHIVNTYEHDQYGFSNEEKDNKKIQVDKRFKKFELAKQEVPTQFWEEEPQAILTFISFGSTKGVIRQARSQLKNQGFATNMLNLSWIWPFPQKQVEEVIKSSQDVVVVEGNSQGQLASLITQETGIKIKNRLNRYDGRPFYPEEIVTYVKNFKKSL